MRLQARSAPSRRVRRLLRCARYLALVVVGLAPTSAAAQSVDPFMWVTDGPIHAMARSGNTLYLGGQFSHVGPSSGSCVVIDSISGVPLDWPRVVGSVTCAAADGAGGWYVGGDFHSVGGLTRQGLAHIRADKSVDGWDPAQSGVVNCIVVRGSTVYVGGLFAVMGGQVRHNIAALDATTGLATAWDPSASYTVRTMALSGSTLYVGGVFTNIGGQPRSYLAALDTGTGLAAAWNPAPDNANITALAVSGSTVYVGGSFAHIGGQPRNSLAAVDSATGSATAWNPGTDGIVDALGVSGSTVYVGGYFHSVDGQGRNFLAAVDVGSGHATAWHPNPDGRVFALAVKGSTVYAGGAFTNIGGEDREGLAALDVSSGLASAWDPRVPQVRTLAAGNASVFATGGFVTVGGQSRSNLAAIDLTTGQATPWNPGAIGGAEAMVNALAVDGSTVYVGGYFTTCGGQSRNGLAAINAASGLATDWDPAPVLDYNGIDALVVSGSTVYAGGSFTRIGGQSRSNIGAVDVTTALATAWDPEADGPVVALALNGSTMYVGGFFNNIGLKQHSNLAALDTTVGQATSWNPGPDNWVRALAAAGSVVYAGGDFSGLSGLDAPHLAVIDAATGHATAFDAQIEGPSVTAITPADSILYVGGPFTSVGVDERHSIAALDPVTGHASPWNPAADGEVDAIVPSGSTVYLGGEFSNICGQYHPYLAAVVARDDEAPTVQALSPGGGDWDVIGTHADITWSASDNVGVQSVDMYVSRSGPTGPWELIAGGVANSGTYHWLVTGPDAIGTAYARVDARDYDGNVGMSATSGPFSIAHLPLAAPTQEPIAAFALSQVAPNPVASRSWVSYAVPRRSPVRVSLLDLQGREVAVLAAGVHDAGRYTATLDAAGLRAGVYFVSLQAGATRLARRVVLMR